MPLLSGNKHQTLPLMGATRLASGFFSSLVPRFPMLFCALRDTYFHNSFTGKR